MMKSALSLLSALILIGWLSSFSLPKRIPNPPGTFRLAPGLYADEGIINHVNWLEYLYYLKQDSSEAVYLAMLPDSTINPLWPEVLSSKKHYRLPLTGTSMQQAESYCRWRSAVVNTAKASAGKSMYTEGGCKAPMAYYKKLTKADPGNQLQIIYRLPTVAEQQQYQKAIGKGGKAAVGATPGNAESFRLIGTKGDKELWNVSEMAGPAIYTTESQHPVAFRCMATYEPQANR